MARRGRNGAAPAEGGVRTATTGMAAGHKAGSQRTTASRVVPDAKDHPPFAEGALPAGQRVEGRMRAEIAECNHGFQLRDGRLEGRIAPQELPGPVPARQRRHCRLRARIAYENVFDRPREDMLRPRSMAPSRQRLSKAAAMRAPAGSTRVPSPSPARSGRMSRPRPCAGRPWDSARQRAAWARSPEGGA